MKQLFYIIYLECYVISSPLLEQLLLTHFGENSSTKYAEEINFSTRVKNIDVFVILKYFRTILYLSLVYACGNIVLSFSAIAIPSIPYR